MGPLKSNLAADRAVRGLIVAKSIPARRDALPRRRTERWQRRFIIGACDASHAARHPKIRYEFSDGSKNYRRSARSAHDPHGVVSGEGGHASRPLFAPCKDGFHGI